MNYKIKEVKLDNGVEGVIIDVPNARTACSRIVFNGGYWSVDDYEKKQQTPHLYEHLASHVKRCADWNNYESELRRNGGYNNAFTNNMYTKYTVKCPAFDIDRIVRLQKYMLENPDYNDADLETEKKNITSELLADSSKVNYLLDVAMLNSVGLPRMTPHDAIETLKNVDIKDVNNYRAQTHATNNMRFLLAGDFAGDYGVANSFGDINLPKGEMITPRRTCPIERRLRVADLRGTIITARVGFMLPRPLTVRESMIMWLVGVLLTGDKTTRVYGKARSAGLVYAMGMQNIVRRDATIDYFRFKCKPENLVALVKLATEAIKGVANGEIDERELEHTKSKLIGYENMLYETPESILNAIEARYLRTGEIIDLNARPDIIRSIKLDEVVTLVREFMDSDIRPFVLCGSVSDGQVNDAYEMLNKCIA